jgi:ribosome biogenesis GTPase
MVQLSALGWNSYFEEQWISVAQPETEPARVSEQQKESYRVVTQNGEVTAEVTGRFRHSARHFSDFPVVGDWVAIRSRDGRVLISAVLPRRTKLSRKSAGLRTDEQLLVANVDAVLIVTSLNEDLSLGRLDRYFSAAWEGGARPVVILNKADLRPNAHEVAADIAASALGASIHVVSAATGQGMDELGIYASRGNTVVLVGSSGVGKSTIINRLLNSEAQTTRDIRSRDGTGRHATTYRRLFILPDGGVLIDTPGIRELQLWDSSEGLSETFEDIAELAAGCRFSDCRHDTEPGCAVRNGVDANRLESYHKLQRELDHLDRRRNAAAQAEQKRIWKQRNKALKVLYKHRNRNS